MSMLPEHMEHAHTTIFSITQPVANQIARAHRPPPASGSFLRHTGVGPMASHHVLRCVAVSGEHLSEVVIDCTMNTHT